MKDNYSFFGENWQNIDSFGIKLKNNKNLCELVAKAFKENIMGTTSFDEKDFKKDYRKFWNTIFELDDYENFPPQVCKMIEADYENYAESHIMAIGMFLERISLITEEKSLYEIRDGIYQRFKGYKVQAKN